MELNDLRRFVVVLVVVWPRTHTVCIPVFLPVCQRVGM